MKLMTLNTHSLIEENYTAKLSHFCAGVIKAQPDIIALQEVNQSTTATFVSCPSDYAGPGRLKADNHALAVATKLAEAGQHY